jgi:hypothetical protein
MAITYTISKKDRYLLITASGKDDSLEEVESYGMAVIQAALINKATHVLCDERQLEYALGTFDIFESARFIAQHVPSLAKTAIVSGTNESQDVAFWETVAVNRGLHVKMFQDIDKAEAWLLG